MIVMTAKELKDYLGIKDSTYFRLVRNPDFPAGMRVTPRKVVYSKDAIDAWLKARECKPADAVCDMEAAND